MSDDLKFDSKTGLPIPGKEAPEPDGQPKPPPLRFDLAGLITVTFLYATCVSISPTPQTMVIAAGLCALVLLWGGLFVETFSKRGGVLERIVIYLFVAAGLLSFYGIFYFRDNIEKPKPNTLPGVATYNWFMYYFCMLFSAVLLLVEGARAKRTNTQEISGYVKWYWILIGAALVFIYFLYIAH